MYSRAGTPINEFGESAILFIGASKTQQCGKVASRYSKDAARYFASFLSVQWTPDVPLCATRRLELNCLVLMETPTLCGQGAHGSIEQSAPAALSARDAG